MRRGQTSAMPSVRGAVLAARTLVLGVLALGGCAADADQPVSAVDGRLLEAEEGTLSASFVMEHPAKGRNPLQIELFDRSSAPLDGAELKVSPWMPAHGHGSAEVTASETEPGVYEAEDVLFVMAGHWELHVDVVTPKSTSHFVVPVNVAEK